MSSVCVNIVDISSFEREVESLRDDMRRNYETFEYMSSTLESKANVAINNASEKINLMNDDLNAAGEAIRRNNEYLERLYDELKILEKREKQAVEALESAQQAQTNANNSSSGSTEEEKKAHDAAVKSANSAVNSASSNLNNIRREKRQVEGKIFEVERANARLEEIKRNIVIYRSGAQEYISTTKNKWDSFKSKKASYVETYKSCESKVVEIIEFTYRAKECINKALNKLADAFNVSQNNQINVRDTRVFSNTATLLKNMKSTVETYAKKQKQSMVEFMDTLGDDVSIMTAKAGRQVMEECIKQTKDFEKLAGYILDAKKYLDNYVLLSNRI